MLIQFRLDDNLIPYLKKRADRKKNNLSIEAKEIVTAELHRDIYAEIAPTVKKWEREK